MGIVWTLIDGRTTAGKYLIFEQQFIVAEVTRREDAEMIVRVHNNAIEIAAGIAAVRKSATP